MATGETRYTEVITDTASSLKKYATEWNSIYTSVNSLFSSLSGVFIGKAQDAFYAANEAHKKDYVYFQELLEDIATTLTKAYENMSEEDTAEASRIRSKYGI
jgi:WXG100 family type VII secretion target